MSKELPKKRDLSLNIWTDIECELLLKVAIQYKNGNGNMFVDWETNESNLEDIYFRFMEEISRNEHASTNGEQNCQSRKFTKAQMSDKLKMIYKDYRSSLYIGYKGGFAKDYDTYFGLCKQLWGETEIPNKCYDNYERRNHCNRLLENIHTVDETYFQSRELEKQMNEMRQKRMDEMNNASESEERREFIDSNLQYYKTSRSKRKVPLPNQLSNYPKNDFALKTELLEKLEEHRKRHQSDMDSMINQMEQQTQLIADGFSLMRSLILPEIENSNPI